MISYGKNIKSADDQLGKVSVKMLYDAIRNPKPHIVALLGQLRVVRQLNPSFYNTLKGQLPYIVCAMFTPPYRRTENFAFTQYFIVDIDHISSRGLVLEDLRHKLESDPRTLMCFKSPGGDGLKVMMKLSERCYDAGLYKTFYKAFVMKLSVQYELQQLVDTRTCDVARACFISADDKAYFNAEPEPIDVRCYINPIANPQEAFDIKHDIDMAANEGDKMIEEQRDIEPDSDVLDSIKKRLNPRLKDKPKRAPAYVPDQLREITNSLREYIQGNEVNVNEIIGIQYGLKLRCSIGTMQAEVNLFYGKRGFSVVQSPRTGTDAAANEVLAEVVESYLVMKGHLSK